MFTVTWMLGNEVDAHKGGPGEDDGRNGNTVEESEETRLNITVRFFYKCFILSF